LSYSTRIYPGPAAKDKEERPHSVSDHDHPSASGLRRRRRCDPERAHGPAVEPSSACEPAAARKSCRLSQQHSHRGRSQCADAWEGRNGCTRDTTELEAILRQFPNCSLAEPCASEPLFDNTGIARAARERKPGGADERAEAVTRQPQSVSGRGELQEPATDRQTNSASFRSASAYERITPD
jgi:hypothetical protein